MIESGSDLNEICGMLLGKSEYTFLNTTTLINRSGNP